MVVLLVQVEMVVEMGAQVFLTLRVT